MVLLALSFCTTFLVSCGEDKEQKIQELQKQVKNEQQMKEKAQHDAEKSNSLFNLLLGISIAITLIALIIGVAMGSKTRKDANSQKPTENGENDE